MTGGMSDVERGGLLIFMQGKKGEDFTRYIEN